MTDLRLPNHDDDVQRRMAQLLTLRYVIEQAKSVRVSDEALQYAGFLHKANDRGD